MVNVWASWCVPCRDEHPFLMELAKDPAIRLVGVNQKDNPENARRFLGQFGNPFAAVGADANGRASIELRRLRRPRDLHRRAGRHHPPQADRPALRGDPAGLQGGAREGEDVRLSEASRRLASNDVGALGKFGA